MVKKKLRVVSIFMVIIIATVYLSWISINAQETGDEGGISLFSLGENNEEILVRGIEATVADYGEAVGYETTSHLCTSFTEYRASMHHAMTVTSASGNTIGYCMQPYMLGPNTNYYEDYNYVEGLGKSHIFNSISEDEANKWKAVYAVALKYGYGGAGADPNKPEVNVQDGGSFGTYLINENGNLKVVKGLMVGGKVYEMTEGEAMAVTQVLIHHICNRGSERTITDYIGKYYPSQTSGAYKHLKAYADNGASLYDNYKSISTVASLYDNYAGTRSTQQWNWYYYDYSKSSWQPYTGGDVKDEAVGPNNEIKLKVSYYSKNMCNKLVNNSSSGNITVKHSYQPFTVGTISSNPGYYDYFSVTSNGSIPISVQYDRVNSTKEAITHELLGNFQYSLDCFTQEAVITIDADALITYGEELPISVATGSGATPAPCYDANSGRYCSRLFSSSSIQDCLMIATNTDTNSQNTIKVSREAEGRIQVNKISGKPDITSNNSCYDMTGAVYNVYSVSSNKDVSKSKLVGTFKTNKEGKGQVTYSKYEGTIVDSTSVTLDKLPIGWYMVCEESAPVNGSYLLDSNKYYVNITKENYKEPQIVESKEMPVADPIPFEIVKECNEGDNVGAATLEGAEFTVWYYKGYYDTYAEIEETGVLPDRTWYFDTRMSASTNNATCIIHEELLLEGSDEPYLNDKGKMILPLGTIVVKETKAPDGYSLEGASYNIVDTITGDKLPIVSPYVSTVKVDQGTVKLSVGNKLLVLEQPVRGDFQLVKKDKHTGEPMAGVPFLVTSKTTGEAHVIVTDGDGIASTASDRVLHTTATNGNDEYAEDKELTTTGVWFVGNSSLGDVNDEVGALPYDEYSVKELPALANKDYTLCEEFDIIISEDKTTLEYGDVINVHVPEIKTEAFDIDGDKIITEKGTVSIVDKVSFSYLDAGKEYILKGQLVYKDTGEAVEINGKALKNEVEFVPENYMGVVEVEFKFDSSSFKIEEFVVYEYLYDKATGELIASHEDIECKEQTISLKIPEVKGVSMVVEEDKTPKTGDGSSVGIVFAILAVALVGVAIILYKIRKNIK